MEQKNKDLLMKFIEGCVKSEEPLWDTAYHIALTYIICVKNFCKKDWEKGCFTLLKVALKQQINPSKDQNEVIEDIIKALK